MAIERFYITAKGQTLLAKAQIGTALHFTKIQVGKGILPDNTDIMGLTALIESVKDVPIAGLDVANKSAKIKGQITNNGLSEPFYWREIGLFATDPDEGEILYVYGYATSNPDYIPAYSVSPTEFAFILSASIQNAANVTAVIEAGTVYATAAQLDGVWNKLKGLDGKSTSDFATAEQGKKADAAIPSSIKGVQNGVATTSSQNRLQQLPCYELSTVSGALVTLNSTSSKGQLKISVNGKTAETGSGNKSPDNPYSLNGVENPIITICGKNLCDIFYAKSKGYITQNADGTLTLNGAATLFNASIFTQEVGNSGKRTVSKLPLLKPNTTYTLKFGSVSGNLATAALYNADGTLNKIVFESLSASNTFTTTSTGIYLDIRITNPNTTVNVNYIMLSDDEAAVNEPYQGTVYPITFTGYSLADVMCDTYDVSSGKLIKKVEIINSTDFSVSLNLNVSSTIYRFLVKTLQNTVTSNATNIMLTNRFGIITPGQSNNSIEGVSLHSGGYLCVNVLKSRMSGWSDSLTVAQKAALFSTWLTANPMTVLYQLATPVVSSSAKRYISAQDGITNVSVSVGTIDVKYCEYPLPPDTWSATYEQGLKADSALQPIGLYQYGIGTIAPTSILDPLDLNLKNGIYSVDFSATGVINLPMFPGASMGLGIVEIKDANSLSRKVKLWAPLYDNISGPYSMRWETMYYVQPQSGTPKWSGWNPVIRGISVNGTLKHPNAGGIILIDFDDYLPSNDWTPILQNSTGNYTGTQSASGTYRRLGTLVNLYAKIVISTLGTGTLKIQGLLDHSTVPTNFSCSILNSSDPSGGVKLLASATIDERNIFIATNSGLLNASQLSVGNVIVINGWYVVPAG